MFVVKSLFGDVLVCDHLLYLYCSVLYTICLYVVYWAPTQHLNMYRIYMLGCSFLSKPCSMITAIWWFDKLYALALTSCKVNVHSVPLYDNIVHNRISFVTGTSSWPTLYLLLHRERNITHVLYRGSKVNHPLLIFEGLDFLTLWHTSWHYWKKYLLFNVLKVF